MAMDGNTMGDAVALALAAVIKAQGQGDPDINQMKKIWEVICTAIVGHITQNAVVPPGIAVATAGSPTSQTGATTAPGKVT